MNIETFQKTQDSTLSLVATISCVYVSHWHGKCQCKCEKGWYKVVQRVKTLLANKFEIGADVEK